MLLLHLFLAFLPYVCLLLTICLLCLKRQADPFFLNVIKGATGWSLAIWLETNLLSWLNLINGPTIAAFWLLYFALVTVLLFRLRRQWHIPRPFAPWPVLLIAALTLIVALAYPPNNYDVLTYHMPRVAQWLQNHSMAPWPTSIDRQIGMAPFNAMIALQSYAPNHLDYFVNLGQWLAFMGCLMGAAALTAQLGGNRLAQTCAVIFTATMPSAIIQASNTESCLIVSFYLCALVYIYLLWRADPDTPYSKMFWFGSCLGLAILSKGSAYPIALPFVCLIAWYCLKSPRQLLLPGVLAASLVIGLNAPHFARAVQGEGSMVASSERNILARPTPGAFLVNNLYHFISNQPLLLNGGGLHLWKNVSSSLGVEQDDKTILPWGGLDGAKDYYVPSDPIAPNPLQAIFVLIAALAIILRKVTMPWHYAGATFAAFGCFCLLLTWHPWVARIHISLFLLIAPLAGIIISAIRRKWLYRFTICFFYFIAIFPTFMCLERPLVPGAVVDYYRHNIQDMWFAPREARLFNNYPTQMAEYIKAADIIAKGQPKNVGIRVGSNALEYPLWSLLQARLGYMPHMYHAIKGHAEPGYIFEFVRQGEQKQTPIRVLEYADGREKVVYPPSGR